MSQDEPRPDEDLLAAACRRAGLGPATLNALVGWLADELYRDRFAQLERTGAAREDGIPLAKVFVDLPVSRRAPAEEATASDFFFIHQLTAARPERPVPAVEASSADLLEQNPMVASGPTPGAGQYRHSGMVLIGGPGQGKSTLCQYLCQVHRAWLLDPRGTAIPVEKSRLAREITSDSERHPRPEELRFPLFLVMSEAAAWLASQSATQQGSPATTAPLLTYAASRAAKRGFQISAEELLLLLAEMDWLLVLDGLDEVPVSAGREVLLREIDVLLAKLGGPRANGLVIATTRPQGYFGELRGRISDEESYLVPLGLPMALAYADRLADARYASSPEQRAKVSERLRRAGEQPTTARLMRTPLQVTILAALVESVGRAPGERWSLFSEYYRVAYDRERERFEASPSTREIADVLRHYRRHIDKIHGQVALLLHVEGEHHGRTDSTLSTERFSQVVDAILAEDEIDALRRADLVSLLGRTVTERLVLLSERSPGQVRFDVRAMQEFFAAAALASKGEDALQRRVLQIARATSFRQVLLFLASKAFSELSDLREFFSGPVCDHLDEEPDATIRAGQPGALLALEILEDGAVIKQSKYVRRLTERAVRLIDLPPSHTLVRLARVAFLDEDAAIDVQPVLLGAIQRGVAAKEPSDRLGAWVALLTLVDRGVEWATDAAEAGWRSMSGARGEIARACFSTLTPVSRWVTDHLSGCLDEVAPVDARRLAGWLSYPKSSAVVPGGNVLDVLRSGLPVRWREIEEGRLFFRTNFVSQEPAERWAAFLALENPPRAWLPLVVASRFLTNPSCETLADGLELLATSGWAQHRQSYPHDVLPWAVRACLEAGESSAELRRLAAQMRAGLLGSAESWRAGEVGSISGEFANRLALLRTGAFRWPLSKSPPVEPPLLGSDLMWDVDKPSDIPIRALLEVLGEEAARPLRTKLATAILDLLRNLTWNRTRVGEPLSIGDLELLWENVEFADLDAVFHCLTEHGFPAELAVLVNSVASRKPLLGNSFLPIIAPWMRAAFVQNPALEGLLAVFALAGRSGVPTLLPASLLVPDSFSNPRAVANARLVSLWQEWMTPELVEETISALCSSIGEDPSFVELGVRIANHMWPGSPNRAAILQSFLSHLPHKHWQLRRSVLDAATTGDQRSSGLDDPRVWDSLQFSLPRPEIPNQPRSISEHPESRPVHIDSIRFQNLRIFADFKINPAKPANGEGQWIVLVGANGRGKTTALRGVALALVDVISQPNRLPPRTFEMPWRRFGTPPEQTVALSVEIGGNTYSARFEYDKDRNDQQRFLQNGDGDRATLPPVFGYGCRRGSALGGARRQVEDEPGTELYTLFDEGLDLTQAETWLILREIEALKEERDKNGDGPACRIYRAVKRAFLDLFGLELLGSRGSQVFVKSGRMGELPLGSLSDGYLTMMGWVVDLLAKWIRRRRNFEEITDGFTQGMTGLVLLDEIDLHIHPAWQKDILSKVRSFFPKLSFIVTTHNPFTLLGASAEEIWVLSLDEQGLVRAEQGTEQPNLLTAAAIYEAYFDNPRDFPHKVGEAWHRYQILAASPIRTDQEDAEARKLLADLRTAGRDPGWEPVEREEIPPYPGDEEDPSATEKAP